MKPYQFPSYDLPEKLDTPRFKEAWSLWIEHLKEKRSKPTSLALKLQLKKLSKMEPWRAVQCIEYSIEHNYQGLWEPKESNGCVFSRQMTKTVTFKSPFIQPIQSETESQQCYEKIMAIFRHKRWQETHRQEVVELFNHLNRVELVSLPFNERKIIMEWVK